MQYGYFKTFANNMLASSHAASEESIVFARLLGGGSYFRCSLPLPNTLKQNEAWHFKNTLRFFVFKFEKILSETTPYREHLSQELVDLTVGMLRENFDLRD